MLTDIYQDFLAGEQVYIWPSRGTNAVPIAFNPSTGLIYSTTWHVPRIQQLLPEPLELVIGGRYTGVSNRFPPVEPGDLLGHIVAIDPLSGEKKWEIPMHDFPSSAGVLATGGRAAVQRQDHRGVHRARRGDRRDAVGVPDRLERQRDPPSPTRSAAGSR